jgi:hypothetical protein
MASPARPGARLEVESTTPTASAAALVPVRLERWPSFVEAGLVRRCPQAARPACR